MRRFAPVAFLALGLFLSVPALAQRKVEKGSAEFKRTCEFAVAPVEGYQREAWIAFCTAGVSADDLLKEMSRSFNPTASLGIVYEAHQASGAGAAVGSDADPEAELLTRKALAAGYEAALEKLGIDGAARKNTRVTVLAFYEAGVRALTMAARDEIDADQFVLVDPPVGELPQVGDDAPRQRGIDVMLHPRSTDEGMAEEEMLLERLGPWASNARVMQSFNRDANLGARVAEIWHSLRGYSIVSGTVTPKAPKRSAETVESLLENLAKYDVVFLGELHGNPGAHAMQYEVLKGLSARWKKLALATEHFERDVQAVVDAYMTKPSAGESVEAHEAAEKAFLKGSRPWPNHADYRPMVEFCREKGIPLVAGNVPRRLAARVNKEGPEVLETFSDEDKSWCASVIVANEGAYKDNFFKVMGSSTKAKRDDEYARLDRMYAAQCLKDDTMAQSTLKWLKDNPGGKVVHINGAFHSTGGLGVPEKLKLANPALKIAIVTCIEADFPAAQNLDAPDAKGNDYVVFVPASRPSRKLKAESNDAPSPHK